MKSAEQNIISFFKANSGNVFSSAELQRMTFKNKNGTLASPKAISRRLQELAEQGIIKVSYTNNHAYYSISEAHRPKKQVVTQLPNGHVRIEYVAA